MPVVRDGPSSPRFTPVPLDGNKHLSTLADLALSSEMKSAMESAPSGNCVCWGIPFDVEKIMVLVDEPVTVQISPLETKWLVFMHTSDLAPSEFNSDGFISPMHGEGRLGQHAANYVALYENGQEQVIPIRRRFHIGAFQHRWGEKCFEAVIHFKDLPLRSHHEQAIPLWGRSQTRVAPISGLPWTNWLWAWENPHPDSPLTGFRLEPMSGIVILFAISAGDASSLPLRWDSRHKARLSLPGDLPFSPTLDEHGLLRDIQLDLGQIISASPRPIYPNDDWSSSNNNQLPHQSDQEMLIEYTAHPDACFHLADGQMLAVERLETSPSEAILQPIAPADQSVRLRVIEKESGRIVPVKLHVHGEGGEYLPPVDRHRIINPAWMEDYGVDFTHRKAHHCTYISGETTLKLPRGKVYIEISKGFEIQPQRKVIEVTPATEEIVIEIEKALDWRKKGWVTADTHVHFLSPVSALLEGAAEGVNVINLLASQWGELMTNVGDFDGKTTWGSKEAGGEGEHLVRVGTENRQHVLGHISLLGYRGNIITPLTTGGPMESAIGDPIDALLVEWARQCERQGGLVVLPHFPDPRAEIAACIVSGVVDAIEMTSWEDLYAGIDPYSLSDWYRYLNCGYLTAAVGGTDKMSAETAVGTVRTYARIPADIAFTYTTWMEAVRRAETFVTYGPLLEFFVDGHPMGSRMQMTAKGGTVDVTWKVESIIIPMTRVELIVNGEIRESVEVSEREASGSWAQKIDKSAWLALLVRGKYPDKPEIIAAHSSPVMVMLDGSELLAAADAVTILEQIEGSLAFIDTIGTRAEDKAYKRMRLALESAHRSIHNRMHQLGRYHDHTPKNDHQEHRPS